MPREQSTALASRPQSLPATRPSIALALGGGGARGLAHILMLEAFDELGIRPTVIAGTSIGAIIGAAYASGISGRQIRAHTEEVLTGRFELLRDLFAARARPVTRLWNVFTARNALLAPDTLLDLVLPRGVKNDFSGLDIPLKIVASDFYGLEARVLETGPLRRAIAASMALPVVFEPVVIDGRALIDGGLTNPLPFDILRGLADILVAIDVGGTPVPSSERPNPTALEALFSASFLFERSIVREKLKASQPDILVGGGTGTFQVLEFWKVKEILAAAEPAKAELKARLTRVLSVPTLPEIEPAADTPQRAPGRRP